jgi:nucleoside-diphosphate-sugar epimerase
MKILVTGGLGLIGHNVVKKLSELDHEVLVVDNRTDYGVIPFDEHDYIMSERSKKISNNVRVREIDVESIHIKHVFSEFNPEIVIHLASFPRQKVVNANPQLGARTMCEGLLNLLENSVKYGVRKFVYTSSSMVYGDFDDYVTEDSVCRSQGQYAIMKYMGEKLIEDYHRKYGLDYIILRPSAVYGELDVEDRVISKFLLSALRGQVLQVNGETEKLDFTYVDDAADGIVSATTTHSAKNRVYNITKSHSVTLLAAANMAVKLAGSGSVEIRNKDSDFPSRGALDITAARRDFNFNPKVDVEEGFQRYYNWITTSEFWKKKIDDR